jgi:hypothetical protein
MMLLLVTIVSLLLAVIMSVVAWRVAYEERRRSAARVAALAADIHGDLELHSRSAPAAISSGGSMFAAAGATQGGTRFAAVMAVGVLVFASAAALMVLFAGPSSTSSVAAASTPASAVTSTENTASAAPVPLELMALGHERDGDRLTVHGVVRNPVAGTTLDGVTAVVFLFNRDGGFVASARAAIEWPALRPGGESTFIVTVPNAGDVGRYRVSFRTDDRIVPHIDRRERGQEKS